jgi:glycosyltransferase involved in cell wall biosynthesis
MLRAIALESRSRGWEADLVFDPAARDRRWLPELEAAGIPVHFSPPIADRGEVARWLGELLAGDPGPVLLHTHFTAFDLPAVAVARRRPRTTVIWHVHTPLLRSRSAWLRNALKFATAGRRVARLLPVTPELGDDVRRRLAPGRRVEFFGNAIDCERFSLVTPEERERARAQFGLADAAGPVLVHFGWDWERKGGDLFLAIVAELRSRGVEATGVTVGGGERASASVERLGMGDAVRLLGPQDRVGDLYAAADVFVSCSRAEGMPFSMLEAIARGTPVVATDIPGQRLVAERLAAARLGPASAVALADLVEESLARPPGERAESRATMERELDVRPWARRLADLYERVSGGG